MGSQRVGHDWATELNWTELNLKSHFALLTEVSQILYAIAYKGKSKTMKTNEYIYQNRNKFRDIQNKLVVTLWEIERGCKVGV